MRPRRKRLAVWSQEGGAMGHQARFTVCPVVGPDAHIHVYCRVPSNSTPRTNCQIDRSVDRLPVQTQMCMHVNM